MPRGYADGLPCRCIVKVAKEKQAAENNAGAGLDIPFESQEPRAPESFRDADTASCSGKQSTAQEDNTDTDKGAPGEQHPDPAASMSHQKGPAEQQQEASSAQSAGKEVRLQVLNLLCPNQQPPGSKP